MAERNDIYTRFLSGGGGTKYIKVAERFSSFKKKDGWDLGDGQRFKLFHVFNISQLTITFNNTSLSWIIIKTFFKVQSVIMGLATTSIQHLKFYYLITVNMLTAKSIAEAQQ